MPLFSGKLLSVAAVASLLSLSGGCVARKMVYGYLDSIMYRIVDNAFDVDSKQKAFLNAKLDELHAWHATFELPIYVEDLRGLEARAADGLDGAEIDWVYARVEDARERLVARLLDDAVAFLVTVTPGQVAHMEEANAKRNAKREKNMGKQESDYIAHVSGRFEKNVKAWFGSITPEQRLMIQAHARWRRTLDENRLQASKANQARLAAVLGKGGDKNGAQEAAVRDAFLAGMWSMSPAKNPYQASIRELLVQLAASASAEQKAHFLKEVRSWRTDFEELNRTHRQASLSRSSGSELSSNTVPH